MRSKKVILITYLNLMLTRPKTYYHPYLLIGFYFNCLPVEVSNHIPRSTRHEWLHRDQAALYGYDWYIQNRPLFNTLQEVAASRQLLRVNRALLRIVALTRFLGSYHQRLKDNIHNINAVVLTNLRKVMEVLGCKRALKYLQRSYGWYYQLRRKQKCRSSLFSLCRIKYPGQLVGREIEVIKTYCSDPRFLLWPLAAVYHQIRRDSAAFFTISTFYKYVSVLGLKRNSVRHRRKNHQMGIRSEGPFQLLHADVTVFKTADNAKNYIHLVQDNYSRAILAYRVSRGCTAKNTFANLERVVQQYLIPSGISSTVLLTDDGSENAVVVKKLSGSSSSLTISHLVAQRDIEFSNSLIEAANKQLKYRFLYHQHIADHAALIKYVKQAIEGYNRRPHDVLNGLTPMEVLEGKVFNKEAFHRQIGQAKELRLAENRKIKCCYYTF